MHLSAFIAASIDGYIAKHNSDLSWLDRFADQGSFGYQEFYSSIDCLVMGRHTFEKVISFPNWPYDKKMVFVLSRTLKQDEIPRDLKKKVTVQSGSPEEIIRKLEGKGYLHAYVDGGRTIEGFLASNCLNELIISWIPVLLGDGIPLFGKEEQEKTLHMVEARAYPAGIIQGRYIIKA